MASTERIGLDLDDINASILNEKQFLLHILENNKSFPKAKRLENCNVENLISENIVGKYKTEEDRKIVTTDLKLIEKFIEAKRDESIPYFPVAGPRQYLKYNPVEVGVGIVNAGGVAPGLNCVINAIVNRHVNTYGLKGHNKGIGVYGITESFLGASSEFSDFALELTPEMTEQWLSRGGSILGMRRHMLQPDNGKSGKEILASKIVEKIEGRLNILYVIGGNGSLSMAHEIAKLTDSFQIIGIPKTMDNDVFWVSESFGFQSAVDTSAYVINTLNDEAESTRRIFLLEVFGAESGFVAAHAAIASGRVDLVLIPEDFVGLTKEQCEDMLFKYFNHLKTRIDQGTPYANVVIAEGTAEVLQRAKVKLGDIEVKKEDKKEKVFLGQLKKIIEDQKWEVKIGKHGSRRERVGVFTNRPEHLIRATKANSTDQIFCDLLGSRAVDSALAGYTDVMTSEWNKSFVLVPLELVANRTKRIDPKGFFWKQVTTNTGQPPNPYHESNK